MKTCFFVSGILGALCGLAQAQTVTVYGAVDLNLATVSNVAGVGRVTGVHNGGLSSSRLGFRGSEDIGNGNSITFMLESDVLADTGTTGTGPLFGRSAWVGARGGWGEARLGRNYTETYEIGAKFDPMMGGNFGGLFALFDSKQASINAISGNSFTSYGSTRVDNSIHYRSPKFAGLSARATYAVGEVADSSRANTTFTGAVEFARGPFAAALVAGQIYAARVGTALSRQKAAYVSYDPGFGRLVYGHTESIGLGVGGGKYVTDFVGANISVNPMFALNAFYGVVRNHVADQKPSAWTLRADYPLSKRSTMYAGYAGSNQDNGSSLNIVNSGKFSHSGGGGNSPAPGADQSGFLVGMIHRF